jgi:hypothetical protein
MRRISTFFILLSLLIGFQELRGQTLTFLFKNSHVVAGPKLQYEIWIKSSNGTSQMGDILIYNDYDTTAFGANIVGNHNVTVTKNSTAFGPTYVTNSSNDNTASLFAFSWTYLGGAGNGVVIPSAGDGVLAFTVQVNIANSSTTSGIMFDSLMINQQLFDNNSNAWPSIDISSTLNVSLSAAPTSPTLLSPANGATGITTSPTLRWNGSTGATSYRLQVSTDSTFSTTFFNDSTLIDTSHQVGPLANNTRFYWRVNAKSAGGTSAYSTVWYFHTTGLVPASPTLLFPPNGATGISLTPILRWNASSGAIWYRLQVSTDSTFSTIIVRDSTLADTSLQVGSLANDTTYYWRVNATNANGTSLYSTAWHFTTIVAPPAPTLLFPPNGATGISLTPILRWNASIGAIWYRLQVSTDSTFSTINVRDLTLADTSLQVGSLANDTTYYWRVNTTNANGTSLYSTAWHFTTLTLVPAVPTLLSPPNGATNVPLNTSLRWDSSSRATSYNLQGSEDSSFSTLSFERNGITDTSASSLPLMTNTRYFWRVSASNSNGTSAYSSPWSFTTVVSAPPTPTLVYPPDGATGVPVDTTFIWNPSIGATSYRLQISTDSTFLTLVDDDSTLTDTLKKIGPLAMGTRYFWRVSASNGAGASLYSATRNFTTVSITIPAPPALDSPADGATEVLTNLTLRWNPSSGANSYSLQVLLASAGSSAIVDTSGITATSFSVSGLAYGTTYAWRVSATNAAGTSNWSAVRIFTTIQLPATPTLQSPADGAADVPITPLLQWLPSIAATSYRIQVSMSRTFSSLTVDDSTQGTSKQVGPLFSSTQYFWRVRASNAGGTSAFSAVFNFITMTISSVEKDEGVIPKSFNLYPNYPNPFNPSTTIQYDLPRQAFVTLKVYNTLKQEVATLVNGEQIAGRYKARFEGLNLASGVYFYRLLARPIDPSQGDGFVASNKMVFLK